MFDELTDDELRAQMDALAWAVSRTRKRKQRGLLQALLAQRAVELHRRKVEAR